jgi:altronate hydrolase
MTIPDSSSNRPRPGSTVSLREAAVQLHPHDHVAIAKIDLQAGVTLVVEDGGSAQAHLQVRQLIPSGHKVAVQGIAAGEPVHRYGQVIGHARQAILPGEHVHTHNLGVQELDREPAFGTAVQPVTMVPEAERRTFLGYRRPDGRVGTRNYIAVLASANCAAHTAREIAHHFASEGMAAYPNVDGVIALTHTMGCPVEHVALQRTLAGMARHPNVAAAVFVGLGCETNQISNVIDNYNLCNVPSVLPGCPPGLVIQELGGIRRTVRAGIATVEAMLPGVNAVERTAQPLSELSLALQCGGSDAWSGVTANPVVGLVADEIVRQGGTVVLAETPEIYGAEHLLAGRAISPKVGQQLLAQVQWWEEYANRAGMVLDDNRSVGNEAGGLTTIYEKSLGAVAKAGSSPLTGVYDYAERVTTRGFTFMNTPGYDPVSVTGQVAGGCNLVLFTTGRGSVFGFKPAPSIKISTHSALYEHMADDIDLDAGRVLSGATMEDVAAELLDLVIAVASGRPSKSEAQGVGEAEFVPWNREGTL